MIGIAGFLSWVGLSLGSALTAAVMPIMHEKIRAERLSMMFWLRVVMLLIALPVLIFTGLPGNPTFYAATFVTAFIWAYADLSSVRAAEEHGGGVMTQLIPLNVVVTFFMWLAIDPATLAGYIDAPIRGLGILAATGAAVFFAMRLQRGKITREHLRALGPVILMSGMGVVYAKIALDSSLSIHSAVFGYMALQAFLMIIIFGVLEAVWSPVPRAIFTGRVAMTSGVLMGLNTVVHMIFKTYGYQMVENPAYVSVIVLTTPIWVMLYYRVVQKQVVGDMKAGLLVIVSVLALLGFISL